MKRSPVNSRGTSDTARPARTTVRTWASKNSPSFAVALKCGIGSSSLKADVNAFEKTTNRARWQFAEFQLEIQIVHRTRQVFWSFQFALHERFANHNLRADIGEFTPRPRFYLVCARARQSTPC